MPTASCAPGAGHIIAHLINAETTCVTIALILEEVGARRDALLEVWVAVEVQTQAHHRTWVPTCIVAAYVKAKW